MNPLAQVRKALDGARRAGLGFDDAWPEAVELAPASWRETLHAIRSAWAAAYDGAGARRLADVVELRQAARQHDTAYPPGRVRLSA